MNYQKDQGTPPSSPPNEKDPYGDGISPLTSADNTPDRIIKRRSETVMPMPMPFPPIGPEPRSYRPYLISPEMALKNTKKELEKNEIIKYYLSLLEQNYARFQNPVSSIDYITNLFIHDLH